MSLRIVTASTPLTVSRLTTVIYAAPGIGKTSLAFTADAPLLLDFDKGAHRSANRGDSVQPEKWADVAGIAPEDLSQYKTLVFDTAGRALDMLSLDIIAKNPKHGNGGSLSLQGYGELKSRFAAFLNLARSFGLDVVLLVHMDEQRRGDELIERLDMQGASKNEVYKSADLMGRLRVKPRGGWALDFSPTDTSFGKNPAAFPVLDVPNFAQEPRFLAGVIEQAKAALNKQTAGQVDAIKELADWQDRFEQATTAQALNALIPEVQKEASDGCRDNAKRLLLKYGQSKGWTFDKALPGFVAPAPVVAPDPDQIDWPEPATV